MASRNDDRDDRQAAAPLARLAVPAPLLGALVLDGVLAGADDALFATWLLFTQALAVALSPRRSLASLTASHDDRPGTQGGRRGGGSCVGGRDGRGVSAPREVTVLGSTGSIGRQAIAVAQQNPGPAADHRAGRRRRRRRPAGRAGADPRRPHRGRRPGHRRAGPAAGLLRRGLRSAAGRRASTRCRRSSPARGRPRSWPPAPPTSSSTASPARSGWGRRCRRCGPGAPSRWPTRSRWSPAATW